MTRTVLDEIIASKRLRLAEVKRSVPLDALVARALNRRVDARPHALRDALGRSDRINIIAEIKRASPSKGMIKDLVDVAGTARDYAEDGAAAVSVLTEEDFFKGSLDDLRTVRSAVDLPVLRKDFTVDEYQIYEAADAGADAILLIAAALNEDELARLHETADDELGMDAIVEVHSLEELDVAKRIGANVIGINNRDLKTLDVSLDISRELIAERDPGTVMIAESGISTRDEIDELRSLGFDGFLIGETLMRRPAILATLAGGNT